MRVTRKGINERMEPLCYVHINLAVGAKDSSKKYMVWRLAEDPWACLGTYEETVTPLPAPAPALRHFTFLPLHPLPASLRRRLGR